MRADWEPLIWEEMPAGFSLTDYPGAGVNVFEKPTSVETGSHRRPR